jgi:hypothetical protein
VRFFNAKSSQAGQLDPGGSSSRARSIVAHACSPSWERFEDLVVCWNLFGDADHQTLEEEFRRSSTQSYVIFRNTTKKKKAPLYLVTL